MTHSLALAAPPFDTILRARLTALIELAGRSRSSVARAVGWSESTLLRKLRLDPADDYRPLMAADVDVVLAVLSLTPDAVMVGALRVGDRDALEWVKAHTRARSGRAWTTDAIAAGVATDIGMERLYHQGLVEIRVAPVDGAPIGYIQLTPAGRRTLHRRR